MEETKRCSFCGEKILAVAIKCKHCSSMLTDPPSPSGSLKGIDMVRQALGDRYEVLHELGRGGMATVYKAIQKNLNRPVALKVIHQNLVHDEEFVKRFHREAQVCASLQHPNIVTVHDEGEVSGVHFLAMEYLEGTDLRELLVSRGRLSPEETLRYMLPIAEALDYAHGRGLIHRDIKSSNIFICHAQTPSANTGDYHGGVTRTLDSEPGEGSLRRGTPASHSTGTGHRSALRVVLMDFGIAHAAAGTQLTRAGAIIGTPEYMSPEQAEGQKVDHRTDLYSLGVVMYECLSGQVPFKGDSAASIIYRVIHEQVDANSLTQSPASVQTLIKALLSKQPAKRPVSAKALAEAMKLLQKGNVWLGVKPSGRENANIHKGKQEASDIESGKNVNESDGRRIATDHTRRVVGGSGSKSESNMENGESIVKKPGFGFYWVYAVLAVILISLQFLNMGGSYVEISQLRFDNEMLVWSAEDGNDIEKLKIINGGIVEIYLKEDRLYKEKYQDAFISRGNRSSPQPHYMFQIASVENFDHHVREVQASWPSEDRFPIFPESRQSWAADALKWILAVGFLTAFWFSFKQRMAAGEKRKRY